MVRNEKGIFVRFLFSLSLLIDLQHTNTSRGTRTKPNPLSCATAPVPSPHNPVAHNPTCKNKLYTHRVYPQRRTLSGIYYTSVCSEGKVSPGGSGIRPVCVGWLSVAWGSNSWFSYLILSVSDSRGDALDLLKFLGALCYFLLHVEANSFPSNTGLFQDDQYPGFAH